MWKNKQLKSNVKIKIKVKYNFYEVFANCSWSKIWTMILYFLLVKLKPMF